MVGQQIIGETEQQVLKVLFTRLITNFHKIRAFTPAEKSKQPDLNSYQKNVLSPQAISEGALDNWGLKG